MKERYFSLKFQKPTNSRVVTSLEDFNKSFEIIGHFALKRSYKFIQYYHHFCVISLNGKREIVEYRSNFSVTEWSLGKVIKRNLSEEEFNGLINNRILYHIQYPMYSQTMAIKAVKRAKSRVSETMYSIVDNNCEHLVSHIFLEISMSKQLKEMTFKGKCVLTSFETLIEVGINGLLSSAIYYADLPISFIINKCQVYLPFKYTIEENVANTIFEISWNSVFCEHQLEMSQLFLKELKKILTQKEMFRKGFKMKLMCRCIGGIIGVIVHEGMGAPHTNIPSKYTYLSYIVGATSGLVIGSILPSSCCPILRHICVQFAPLLIRSLKYYTLTKSIRWSVKKLN